MSGFIEWVDLCDFPGMVGWLVGLVSACSDPGRWFPGGVVRHGPFQMVAPRSLQVVCLTVRSTPYKGACTSIKSMIADKDKNAKIFCLNLLSLILVQSRP